MRGGQQYIIHNKPKIKDYVESKNKKFKYHSMNKNSELKFSFRKKNNQDSDNKMHKLSLEKDSTNVPKIKENEIQSKIKDVNSKTNDIDNGEEIDKCIGCNDILTEEHKKPHWKWNLNNNGNFCLKCYDIKEKEY